MSRSLTSSDPFGRRTLPGRGGPRRLVIAVAFAGVLALAAPVSAGAAYDAFLKIPKFPGESQHVEFKGWVEVQTASLGIKRASRAASPTFNPLVLTKPIDSSTPSFFGAVAKGTAIPSAWMYVEKAGGAPQTFLRYAFENVVVLSDQFTLKTGDDAPMETITVIYGKVTVSYTPYDGNGLALSPLIQGWNINTQTGSTVFPQPPEETL